MGFPASADDVTADPTTPEGGPGPASEGLLDQDEIDSLLGFGDADDGQLDSAGIHAVLNRDVVAYGRLPVLEMVFDRLVERLAGSFRQATSDAAEVSLGPVRSIRFGDHLVDLDPPGLHAIVGAEPWNGDVLVSIDSDLVYALVDVLLGGRRGKPAARGGSRRSYTTIERCLVNQFVRVVLDDLAHAFQPVSAVSFRCQRLESDPRFAAIARATDACVRVRLGIAVDGRDGQMDIVIPYATLEPVREHLVQMVVGEKFGRDPIWQAHLAESLWTTRVELTAVLDECDVPLADIVDLKVGSRIVFNVAPEAPIQLRCAGVALYTAITGRRGGSLAVQIENPINTRRQSR